MKPRKLSELYKLVKERLEKSFKDDNEGFICNCINALNWGEIITDSEYNKLDSDFQRRKEEARHIAPQGYIDGYSWWEGEEQTSRIKFLDYLIELHENNNN